MRKLTSPILLLCFLVSLTAISQNITDKEYRVLSIKSKDMATAPKKVYIKNFKIFYQMIAEAEKTSYGGRQLGGGSYTGNATARLAVGVEGVDPADLQEMTNKLYSDYVSKLEALGLEVISVDQLPTNEFFQEWELKEGPRINEDQIKGSLMVIPEGFSYYVKGVNKKGKEKTGAFMAGVSKDAGGFLTSTSGPVPKLSDEIDDIIIVEVAMNVPAIYLDPKTNFGAAKVKGGAYLRLQQAKASYVSGKLKKPGVAYPATAVELTLTKPIPLPAVFGEQNFKSVATKSRTTTPSYAAFFTVENKTVDLQNTIKCKSEDYTREVSNVITEYLDISLEKLSQAMAGEKVK